MILEQIRQHFLAIPGVTDVEVVPRTGYNVYVTIADWDAELPVYNAEYALGPEIDADFHLRITKIGEADDE